MNNYNAHNLVTFSNSLLKHFGVKPFHQTEEAVDKILTNHKKVVTILFDGMGRNIVRMHLKENSFLREHYLCTINSTFPPTTTAATTAFLTGKYPIETGWMAWAQYFEKYNRNIILFRNADYNSDEKITPEHIADNELPVKFITDLIKEQNPSVQTFNVKRFPVDPNGPKKLRDLEKIIDSKITGVDSCFGYFYFDSPDYEMHAHGIDNWRIHIITRRINDIVRRLAKKHPDTLFLIFADHGHINVKFLDICEHEDIYSLLRAPVSFEKRTPAFFVKEGKQEEFAKLFKKYYGEHFELMSKQEALDSKIFGEGKVHPKAASFLGDYIATSTGKYCLYASKEMKHLDIFKGHHAGNTIEEMLIDVSAYNV